MGKNDLMKQEKYYDKFFFYDGCDSIQEQLDNIQAIGYDKARGYFIKYNDQFYAVFLEGMGRQVILGKDKIFFTKAGRLREGIIGIDHPNYTIGSRAIKFFTDTLARELLSLDSGLEVYYYKTVKSAEPVPVEDRAIILSNYVVLLGVTFSSRFYTVNEAREMDKYFKHTPEILSFLRRTKGAVAIDPFTNQIMFEDGSLGCYSFQMSTGRNEQYRSGGWGVTPVMGLETRNKYSTFRKRDWPSLTQYHAMYPDDDIFNVRYDFRENKNTCKWCGKPLPEGSRKQYCSDGCKIKYREKTVIERGAQLPYLIMLRDKFICQECGKDMMYINEHGVRIPVSVLSEEPDADGKFRSEAEVHHIDEYANSHNHHSSNLGTHCEGCHKKKHHVRKRKE